jgi:hypothetical protein
VHDDVEVDVDVIVDGDGDVNHDHDHDGLYEWFMKRVLMSSLTLKFGLT